MTGGQTSALNSGRTAQVEKIVDAPAAEIWKAITTPASLKKFFFGSDVVSDWKVGSPITMKGEFKGKAYEDKGEILTFDAPRVLAFSHWSAMSGDADTPENYHVVTFELEPAGTATRVTLSQANLEGGVKDSDVKHRADYEKNWGMVLDGLAKLFR